MSPIATASRTSRRSSGLQEFTRLIKTDEVLTLLDLGPTSASNITYLTGLGHKLHSEDVLEASTDSTYKTTGADGVVTVDVERFLKENLVFRDKKFDAVLCWDIPDYLPEPLVKPMIERLHGALKPGGMVLGFFHTRDAGPNAPYCRYHIAGADVLDMQPVPRFRLQRVFNNRHIETLFQSFKSLKFFLARDYLREVLAVK
jgi:2-polyprenyl-3-methyl-5-hydroxy-6-metoxy-1,4-benzoquinol methylase